MNERWMEAFVGRDGKTVMAACRENGTEWTLYSREGFAPGEVIRRQREGARAIVGVEREKTPDGAALMLTRQRAERIREW